MKKIIITMAIVLIIAAFVLLINLSIKNNTFTNTNNKEAAAVETIEIKEEKYLSGTYEWDPGVPTTAFIYYFTPDGNVIRYTDGTSKGTYKIENNQLLISIYESIGPDNYVVPNPHQELTFTIVDDNTLLSPEGKDFHKISEENVVLIKQQKEMEQFGE